MSLHKFPIPLIVISKCFNFDTCRYNASMISNNFTQMLDPYVKFLPVCPEVEIGLGIPRDVIRVVQDKNGNKSLVQPSTERDLTKMMSGFSNKFLDSLASVDGFILKARSPSCGIRNAKYFRDNNSVIHADKGPGMFAERVLEKFPGMAIEDEDRLRNSRIREHFLLKLFTLARFRQVKGRNSLKALVQFQAVNKYIFMTYNQHEIRTLGRITVNKDKLPVSEVVSEYEIRLHHTLSHIPQRNSHINTLMHAISHFKNMLTSEEKRFIADLLNDYREGVIPLSFMNSVMRSWIIKYKVIHLGQQSYFAPYPKELLEISDSARD